MPLDVEGTCGHLWLWFTLQLYLIMSTRVMAAAAGLLLFGACVVILSPGATEHPPSSQGSLPAVPNDLVYTETRDFTHFTHPGLLHSYRDLEYTKAKITAGKEPWASGYKQMMDSHFASLSYTASPRAVVTCGQYNRE